MSPGKSVTCNSDGDALHGRDEDPQRWRRGSAPYEVKYSSPVKQRPSYPHDRTAAGLDLGRTSGRYRWLPRLWT